MTDGFRSFVVVNPRSAGGSTARRWPAIQIALTESLGEFGHAFTDAAGGGTRLAANALRQGYEMIVAIGGDGTLNEVVNGFFDEAGKPIRPGAVIGTIARGTGKDFIRTAAIPKEIGAAARALAGRQVRPWDVGRVTVPGPDGKNRVQYFLNESDFGVGGEISRRVNASSKRFGGFLSFFWATVVSLSKYRARRVRLRADGEDLGEHSVKSVIVAIGRYCGGGMQLAPCAVPDDGLLDLVIIPDLTMVETFNNITRLYDGSLLAYPRIRHRRCRVIEAESAEDVKIGIDGESTHVLPAKFDILPGAVKVKVP